jgi:hypothetical protein
MRVIVFLSLSSVIIPLSTNILDTIIASSYIKNPPKNEIRKNFDDHDRRPLYLQSTYISPIVYDAKRMPDVIRKVLPILKAIA